MGYHRAGFDVIGVDISPQPHYPFEFIQADAMRYLEHPSWAPNFDAIHASPPCQGYSRMRHLPWLRDRTYPMLLEPVRERLAALGVPWVIENVEDAPMPYSVVLCGWTLGLPLYRHRRFGASFLMWQEPHRRHREVICGGSRNMAARYRQGGGRDVTGVLAGRSNEDAMGIDWMTKAELAQAIPPAYTEWIGERLIAEVIS